MNKYNKLFVSGASALISLMVVSVTVLVFVISKPSFAKKQKDQLTDLIDTVKIEVPVIKYDTIKVPSTCKKRHCETVVIPNPTVSISDSTNKQPE
jgi:hypothetical protein